MNIQQFVLESIHLFLHNYIYIYIFLCKLYIIIKSDLLCNNFSLDQTFDFHTKECINNDFILFLAYIYILYRGQKIMAVVFDYS